MREGKFPHVLSVNEVESTRLIQNLSRPVRGVLINSAETLSVRAIDVNRPEIWARRFARIDQRLAQFAEPPGRTDIRKIGPQVSATSADHMARGALSFAKEDRFTRLDIARNR